MPIHRIEVNAPAAPRTPIMATVTAERRWEEVGMVKEEGSVGSIVVDVVFEGMVVVELELDEEVKNEVGRAIRTTPRREIRDAY